MKRSPSAGPDTPRPIANSALMQSTGGVPQESAPRVSAGRAAPPLPSGFVRYRILAEAQPAQYALTLATRVINVPGSAGLHEIDASVRQQYVNAAEQGDAASQFNLGLMHDRGIGVATDVAHALAWYGKAAAQGYAPAECNLGAMYITGRGVAKDDVQAFEWMYKSAVQGNSAALSNICVMHASGRGVAKDDARTIALICEAAALGNPRAQFRLGVMYRTGGGVTRDDTKAAEWFVKAAAQGHEDAQAIMDWMAAQH